MAVSDLRSIAYPKLSKEQSEELAQRADASTRTYEDGQALFDCGDSETCFYVVRSGAVEITDCSGDEPKIIAVHQPGEFTGDVTLLTGARAIVSGVARGTTVVYETPVDRLRQVLNEWPALSDVILQAFIARRQLLKESPDYTGLRLIGSRYDPETFRIRDFLARNCVLFTWLDVETDPEMDRLLAQFGITKEEMPVLACGHKLLLRNPSNQELASRLGIRHTPGRTVYDLVVVGAGPAGLAAAVYGASEGLNTVVLERTAPGGQAGSSMRIENYLGFPTGLTGRELADRAAIQAAKFGAEISTPTPVARIEFDNQYPVLRLDGGETVRTKCLLIATGADYRKLEVEGCEQFEGTGVYYAATPNEAQVCRGTPVVVVGGGNSAGQAAVFLAEHARKVLILVRNDDLNKSMSAYLVRRIERTPNIEVLYNTEVCRICGNGRLSSVDVVNNQTGEKQCIEAVALFSFIGAAPRTDWLPPEIEKDLKGFVSTGPALEHSGNWSARRQPFLLESSRPGVFAAGDVRSGSVKRVASAVGEGAMAVQFVHQYLAEM